MKTKLIVIVLVMMHSLNACANSVRVNVHVIDDDGNAVVGANVKGAFNDLSGNSQFLPSMKSSTDTDGNAVISGGSFFYIPIWVNKNDYYESKSEVDGRHSGTREVSILLRPIRNPIAMYAKHFKGFIPIDKLTRVRVKLNILYSRISFERERNRVKICRKF